MATLSGSYRSTNIATIAAMITLIDAHLAAENARMIVLGGAATRIIGNITLVIRAANGLGIVYSHRINTLFNTLTLAGSAVITAALAIYVTTVEANSDFTTVVEVDVSMNTTMSN